MKNFETFSTLVGANLTLFESVDHKLTVSFSNDNFDIYLNDIYFARMKFYQFQNSINFEFHVKMVSTGLN